MRIPGTPLPPGEVLQKRYEIKEYIARGGMGAVYLASDSRLGHKQCAIKETFFSNDADMLKLFQREAEMLAKLDYRHLPRVTDYFSEDGGNFLVMDYIAGKDLHKQLEDNGKPFPVETVLDWAGQLLETLHYLHSQPTPLIHRDIKPLNVKPQPDGRLMLLDFGLVKGAATGMTHGVDSIPLYTKGYAPLEQVLRADHKCGERQWLDVLEFADKTKLETVLQEETDARSDLYALGATLYQLLTYQPPQQYGFPAFAPTRALHLWNKHDDPFILTQKLNPQVTDAVAEVLHRALALRRNDRYDSAEAMLDALRTARRPGHNLKSFSFETVTVNEQGDIIKRHKKQARYYVEDVQGLGLEMVEIPKGRFLMGSNTAEVTAFKAEAKRYGWSEEWIDRETPQHWVTLAQPFFLGKYAVTQKQWRIIAGWPKVSLDLEKEPGLDPSDFKGDDLPVEQVSWFDAMEFCLRLQQVTGRLYRLPSEAEWEYACRAGTSTPFPYGPTITPEIVNYDGNYPYGQAKKGSYKSRTLPVNSGIPTGFGLYNICGNVWEWCLDEWRENYNGAPDDGSAVGNITNVSVSDSTSRVLRGGSWCDDARGCRSAHRGWFRPDFRFNGLGFRVVAASAV